MTVSESCQVFFCRHLPSRGGGRGWSVEVDGNCSGSFSCPSYSLVNSVSLFPFVFLLVFLFFSAGLPLFPGTRDSAAFLGSLISAGGQTSRARHLLVSPLVPQLTLPHMFYVPPATYSSPIFSSSLVVTCVVTCGHLCGNLWSHVW